jgi:hypothetical protein
MEEETIMSKIRLTKLEEQMADSILRNSTEYQDVTYAIKVAGVPLSKALQYLYDQGAQKSPKLSAAVRLYSKDHSTPPPVDVRAEEYEGTDESGYFLETRYYAEDGKLIHSVKEYLK